MIARSIVLIFLLLGFAASAQAQERDVPYWATIRATELNMRVGPSADYKIDWVYRRQGLPVRVVRVMEGWRLIEDPDGARGWVVARLLSPDRGAIVIGGDIVTMRADPDENAEVKWRLEPGVVGALGDCEDAWCFFTVNERHGFVRQESLLGAGEP